MLNVDLTVRLFRLSLAVTLGAALVACGGDQGSTRPDDKPVGGPADPAKGQGSAPGGDKREIRLLITTDEHGWLEPFMDRAAGMRRGGVVEAFDMMVSGDGLGRPEVVLLSAGDMWTGPYETTVLEGQPMVAAFNRMGYRAAAVGNHEFDFGLRILEKRASEAEFSLLAANVREAASGAVPSWAKPWVVVDAGGLKLGVIGLVYDKAFQATDPRHLVGLEIGGYEEALRAEVPKLKAAGAEQMALLIHDRLAAATRLAPVLRELGISVVGVGHAHQASSFVDTGGTPDQIDDDVVFCNAGAYLRSYCRVDVGYQGGKLTFRQVGVQQVARPITEEVASADPKLLQVVQEAQRASEKIGGEVLVKSDRIIRRDNGSLGQFIVDTWLEALPYAQVAITNNGGIRQDLPKGKVRVRDVVSVLPFNNYLLVVELTGAQIREVLANPESVQAGLRYTYRETPGGRVVLELADREGKTIGDEQRLKVIINDFMYRGGDGYGFLRMDRNPEETAIDWREPVLRALRAKGRADAKLEVNADDRARKVE